MTTLLAALATANDAAPDVGEDHAQILEGLGARQKWISPKYFYDERGSELFDQICRLPEYYPTRTELTLMDRHLAEIASLVGPRAAVIEFGAGSNLKVRKLLNHLERPAAYVPVEISADYLVKQAEELARDYPNVHVQPVFADFTEPFELPSHPVMPARNLIFFPGSTIGNFTRPQAAELLAVMRHEARAGGALLIGVDLRKNPATLHAAYNDNQGVTAAFNLNVLRRLNRELGADFVLEHFRHEAIYDQGEGRIEMRLVSTRPQTISLAGQQIAFAQEEHIITEYSHKYSIEEFVALAEGAGFDAGKTWVDEDSLFSIHFMTAR
ncbi:L-histidine N(alpha)-methyltransferase [Candidatus Rariloculus sp.]|uniref:L-histidine N(alpha)-methyltransferase n=1 Tax=Candidatus Rariloculus sp. TaxID=3101265 RepID=UPI003D0DC471